MTLDQDLSEHPSVLVDNGSTTPIGRTGASAVALAVSGLPADDNGTLTFSDGTHSVTVTIANGQVVAGENNTTTTVNLSTLTNEQTKLPWVMLPEGIPSFDAYYDARKLWPPASLERRRATSDELLLRGMLVQISRKPGADTLQPGD